MRRPPAGVASRLAGGAQLSASRYTAGEMPEHCCESMDRALRFARTKHESPFECPDSLVSHSSSTGRFGLIVHDGGTSSVTIEFCPWCGANLCAPERKNIQVIDSAANCVYDVFAATPEEFALIFKANTDIAFAEDLDDSGATQTALEALWQRPVPKNQVRGIHGTLFCDLPDKRRFYPSLRDADARNPDGSRLRAKPAV